MKPSFSKLTTYIAGVAVFAMALAAGTLCSGADASGDAAFSPVMETDLKVTESRTEELLDLDTGKRVAMANFGENDRETHAWIRTNRVDVLGVIERGRIGVLCFDVAVVPAASNSWSSITPQQVLSNWSLGQQEPSKITAVSPAIDKTDTFLFRTREGHSGLLQILGPAASGSAVRIRYRLVEQPGKV